MAASAAISGKAQAMPAAKPAPLDRRRTFAFFCMVFGMFMAILDIQIVSASLAEIQAGLSASSEEISWVQTSYLIAEVIMIPLSGTLSRVLSTRWMFVIASGGFTFMSFMCATATNIDQMIVYRALQGFIGGGMIPTVFASAFTIFPPEKRPVISPIIGLVATLAPTIGPTLGGYLTDLFSWHWLFLVNIVPGIFVTVSTYLLVDFDEPDFNLFKSFDWAGLGFMAAFLGSLEYVLEEGPLNDWFQDEAVLILTIVCVVGGIGFFYRAFNAKQPIVDLRAFADRNFLAGSAFSFVMGIGLYGLTYLYPVYLARVRGYSSLQIGETMFVTGAMHVPHGAGGGNPVAQAGSAADDGHRLRRLCLRHLADHRPHQGLGFLGAVRAADLPRRRAHDLHGADQQHRARNLVAGPDQERVGPLQPHPQSRRRGGPRSHQYALEQPPRPASPAPARERDLGQLPRRWRPSTP